MNDHMAKLAALNIDLKTRKHEMDKALHCLFLATENHVARDVREKVLAYTKALEAKIAEVERQASLVNPSKPNEHTKHATSADEAREDRQLAT
jgi:hypothetical protein